MAIATRSRLAQLPAEVRVDHRAELRTARHLLFAEFAALLAKLSLETHRRTDPVFPAVAVVGRLLARSLGNDRGSVVEHPARSAIGTLVIPDLEIRDACHASPPAA